MKNKNFKLDTKNLYTVECFDADGKLRWTETIENLVVDEGRTEILQQFYNGNAYTASHFVGLLSAAPTIADSDTMTSHAGWSEVTSYNEAARPALNMGTAVSSSIDNSASPAQFTINATVTVGGAFISTDSVVGGTAGKLIGAGAFSSGDRQLKNGDSLRVTVTATATSS